MLPRSGRVGTIYTSAAEVRDRSRPAHGAFYSTISLPVLVYKNLAGKGLMKLVMVIVRLAGVPARRRSDSSHHWTRGLVRFFSHVDRYDRRAPLSRHWHCPRETHRRWTCRRASDVAWRWRDRQTGARGTARALARLDRGRPGPRLGARPLRAGCCGAPEAGHTAQLSALLVVVRVVSPRTPANRKITRSKPRKTHWT